MKRISNLILCSWPFFRRTWPTLRLNTRRRLDSHLKKLSWRKWKETWKRFFYRFWATDKTNSSRVIWNSILNEILASFGEVSSAANYSCSFMFPVSCRLWSHGPYGCFSSEQVNKCRLSNRNFEPKFFRVYGAFQFPRRQSQSNLLAVGKSVPCSCYILL